MQQLVHLADVYRVWDLSTGFGFIGDLATMKMFTLSSLLCASSAFTLPTVKLAYRVWNPEVRSHGATNLGFCMFVCPPT